jgi:hypothetical protein
LEWPAVDASAAQGSNDNLVQFDLPLHVAAEPLAVRGDYVFCMRCSDEYGRWTPWSAASDPESIGAPDLYPPQSDALQINDISSSRVLLEWSHFRPRWAGVAVQKGIEESLQRIAYRLRLTKRLASGTGDWVSMPITELVSERRSSSALSHEVSELDGRYEYIFHLSARWIDMPLLLGGREWSPEVSSVLLPTRLKELHAPEAPLVELSVSEMEGLSFDVRWHPSLALRVGSKGAPVPGSRYQLRFAQISPGLDLSRYHLDLASVLDNWQVMQPVLESAEALADMPTFEAVAKLRGLAAGSTYCVSVRMGDEYRWSPWSGPSDPVAVAVPPPIPNTGDLLELAGDTTTAVDAVRLEWRPFRAAPGLQRIEYKIMALEWPCEEQHASQAGSSDVSLRMRLQRVADIACIGSGSPRVFRAVGYTSKHCPTTPPLRAQAERLEWRTEGLRPGMYYRFFVCARYVALPMGALAPPPGLPSETAVEPWMIAWPDEHCQRLCGDQAVWESSLSRFGLWSPVVNTLHLPQYAVRIPTQLNCSPAKALAAPMQKTARSDSPSLSPKPGASGRTLDAADDSYAETAVPACSRSLDAAEDSYVETVVPSLHTMATAAPKVCENVVASGTCHNAAATQGGRRTGNVEAWLQSDQVET